MTMTPKSLLLDILEQALEWELDDEIAVQIGALIEAIRTDDADMLRLLLTMDRVPPQTPPTSVS